MVIMPYLTTFEQIWMQGSSKWWYEIGTGRIQREIKLPKTFYFSCNGQIYAYNKLEGRIQLNFGGKRELQKEGWRDC